VIGEYGTYDKKKQCTDVAKLLTLKWSLNREKLFAIGINVYASNLLACSLALRPFKKNLGLFMTEAHSSLFTSNYTGVSPS
jgi:hypothetical protein